MIAVPRRDQEIDVRRRAQRRVPVEALAHRGALDDGVVNCGGGEDSGYALGQVALQQIARPGVPELGPGPARIRICWKAQTVMSNLRRPQWCEPRGAQAINRRCETGLDEDRASGGDVAQRRDEPPRGCDMVCRGATVMIGPGYGDGSVAMLSRESRFEVCDQVLDQEIQGESVLLHLGSESYFSLNATGTLVWRCLREGGTLGEAVARLVAEQTVEVAIAERDVTALALELMAAGLMNIRE